MYKLLLGLTMQTMPFSQARAHLAEALRGVELAQEPLLISRRGQAAGVLMSLANYQQLAGSSGGFSARLADWRAQYSQALDESNDFTSPRDPIEGRDFSW
jgi:prevent-host-death family protein